MVVQHNLRAMNSNRMLGITSGTLSKSSEKLSSGYKINRAADDAAGLSISEKMRKQIRGLTQATANAEDGISAVQTAEGALTEVHDMLQRMNELAVKAANGTMSESDRTAVQNEVDQLATEIDRVAETTKFNETYLLKGDKDVEKSNSYSYKAVETTVAAQATMSQDKATNLTATITFKEGANAADQNTIAKALRDQGITISSKQNDAKDGASYGVTLNGSAANSYKVNTIKASGTNDGSDKTDVTGAAKFEIVDLQGNKIADVEVSGGIGTGVAAESSKVITAEKVGAAENQGDVKQFYDADGNAISENALGSYFSKLSAEGGAKVLYTATGEATADDINTAKTAGTALYTTLKGTAAQGTAAANGITKVAGLPEGAEVGDVYTFDGKDWKDANNRVVTGIVIEGKVAAGNTITVAVDTTIKSAEADFKETTALYKADGTKITDKADLKTALDASTTLYTAEPRELTAITVGAGTPKLKDGAVLKNDTYTYATTGTKWTNAAGDDVTDAVKAAIANYDTLTLANNNTFKVQTKAAAVAAAEDTDYTYKLTYEVASGVAAQAGKQLYDAVGNALDGGLKPDGTSKRPTMAEAADLVASSNNLTGALILSLHVGADATKNNQIDLKIEAMSAKGLGINGIRVDGKNDSNALKSVETIKEALAKVSAQRSALGAVQNRLEHTINNLENVVENTTSAESAIRDTDMATEMVKFSNSNILAQAGQSMLAQANQANQGVLSLLG